MRKKKNIDKRLEECNELIITKETIPDGGVSTLFSKTQKLYLEIGCGKGGFCIKMCQQPDRDFNYIAMEKVQEAIVMGMEKAKLTGVKDLFFIIDDANDIDKIFSENEVDKIFINFCDPWSQKKRFKRRLTHQNFLNQYKKILKNDGEICFKTDNQGLFEFSLEEFSKCGFILKDISLDLHKSKFAQINQTTEYEEKFSSQGFSIYRLVGVNKK
jgi:tRNA (guanine-N7-)-methyltransferase